MSTVLVQEVNGAQHPVYSASEALQGAKTRYIEIAKLAHALLIASCKLCHYLMMYVITMPLSYPLNTLLHNKDATRRIEKWAAKLAPFDLKFTARMAIKS